MVPSAFTRLVVIAANSVTVMLFASVMNKPPAPTLILKFVTLVSMWFSAAPNMPLAPVTLTRKFCAVTSVSVVPLSVMLLAIKLTSPFVVLKAPSDRSPVILKRILPSVVVAVAPSVMVAAPAASMSMSPTVVDTSPAAAKVMSCPANKLMWPDPAFRLLFNVISPALSRVCRRTLPTPTALIASSLASLPELTIKLPAVTVMTMAPSAVVVRSSWLLSTLLSAPVLPTRCTVVLTSPMIKPLVSVMKRPSAAALAANVPTAVFSTLALLPIPLPAVIIRPFAVIKLSLSRPAISSPAIRFKLPVPTVTVSVVMLPAVASTRASPSVVIKLVPSAIVTLRPAVTSIVFALAAVLRSAFCNTSCPAFKLIWPAELLTFAFKVRSDIEPPALNKRLPAAVTPPVTALVMLPAVVRSTRSAPDVTLETLASAEIELVTVPSDLTRFVSIAVTDKDKVVCSRMNNPPAVASAANWLISVVNCLSWAAIFCAALKRNSFA